MTKLRVVRLAPALIVFAAACSSGGDTAESAADAANPCAIEAATPCAADAYDDTEMLDDAETYEGAENPCAAEAYDEVEWFDDAETYEGAENPCAPAYARVTWEVEVGSADVFVDGSVIGTADLTRMVKPGIRSFEWRGRQGVQCSTTDSIPQNVARCYRCMADGTVGRCGSDSSF